MLLKVKNFQYYLLEALFFLCIGHKWHPIRHIVHHVHQVSQHYVVIILASLCTGEENDFFSLKMLIII